MNPVFSLGLVKPQSKFSAPSCFRAGLILLNLARPAKPKTLNSQSTEGKAGLAYFNHKTREATQMLTETLTEGQVIAIEIVGILLLLIIGGIMFGGFGSSGSGSSKPKSSSGGKIFSKGGDDDK